jgi:RHS repeat-associated protein
MIEEKIDSDGNGTIDHETVFAYDGNQIVLQFDKDGSGLLDSSDLSHRYTWQPNAVDQIMADERTYLDGSGHIATDEVLWALTDRLGSVNDLAKYNATTGETAVVDHIIRDSFGKVISESNPSQGCLIGWTGRPTSKATGLQNNLNRWYDPIVAGWLSQDPMGFKSGTTNLYVYCGNIPINFVDPTGLVQFPVNWIPPTNPPQWPIPLENLPPGWTVRIMPPSELYPDGYWILQKPMDNGGWQRINPSTMKPGPMPDTHVPLPPIPPAWPWWLPRSIFLPILVIPRDMLGPMLGIPPDPWDPCTA